MRSSATKILVASMLWLLAGVLGGVSARAIDVQDTRLLTDPAISADHVAFAYAGDLWVANRDGSGVRRLTSDVGDERRPRFSPDGSLVAFTGEYEGNVDVYVVPVEGGVPFRLTWHPGPDTVEDFSPDGTRILFSSSRQAFTRAYTQLYTIPLAGGWSQRLPIPNGYKASFSPDGRKIAYLPLPEAFRQWKNYRGGRVSRIWVYDTETHAVQQVPQPEGRCNDTDPVWIGPKVYFLSDRAGEFNLFAFDTGTEDVEQLTFFDDFPAVALQAGDGGLILEQAGYLHTMEIGQSRPQRLVLGVAADLPGIRVRYAEGARFLRDASLSPSGARALLEFRGEIVSLPASKGDPRNLTATVAVHERSPVWSPDGSSVAYFSDASGEYELHVRSVDGGGVRRYELGGDRGGSGFYFDPRFSPDGRFLSYADNSWSLFVLDFESGETKKIGSERLYGPERSLTLNHRWAPDSRWLAYTLNTAANIRQIFVYSLEEGRSYPVTDGLSDAAEPVFDGSGKYLYFVASTNAGPVRHWFAMSNADMELSRSLYLAVLDRDEPSPLARESDEETGAAGGSGGEEQAVAADAVLPPRVEIDFDGLDQRILALPLPAAGYSSLEATDGKLFYLRQTRVGVAVPPSDGSSLRSFDLRERQEETLLDGVSMFSLSADGKRLLYRRGDELAIVDAGPEIEAGQGVLALDRVQVRVDPPAEWEQMFEEAWRINRDYFYDPNMHGADWPAMREKYRPFLADLATRQDLNRVIRWMCSELAVGHHRVRGGDFGEEPERIAGGLLGADFEIADGRYRFARVLGGLNWNPELRSPLTEPGVDVREGDFLLAVQGRELDATENLFRRFENTAGRIVEITVGPSADGAGARTVQVVPIEDEQALRNRAWVEGNLERVQEATGGRVAYVYVPNTAREGHTYFKRYFFPQVDKEAIIIDERFNAGGQVADYAIDLLRRPYLAHWATRYGVDIKTPLGSIQGPKVMIINEVAGSGGDMLPWMFRKLGLGTLVGKRTWGGLVGVLGFPVLMDGGTVTAPNLAIWTEDGFVVENVGVPPDIEVEQWPAEVIAGRDPQLEKAIEVVMEKLAESPPQRPQRPPYPIRVRR